MTVIGVSGYTDSTYLALTLAQGIINLGAFPEDIIFFV